MCFEESLTELCIHVVCTLFFFFLLFISEYSSERFQMFLELLGDEVQLRGWEQFRGGLDCKSEWEGLGKLKMKLVGGTGKESINRSVRVAVGVALMVEKLGRA